MYQNHLEVFNQTRQSSVFTLRKDDLYGLNLLKNAKINFEKIGSNNKMNWKQTNIIQFYIFYKTHHTLKKKKNFNYALQ